MTPEAGKVYRRGDGAKVHIQGHTTATSTVGPTGFYSQEADHYTADGRFVSRERSDHMALVEEIGTHDDAGKGKGWAHSNCTACGVSADDEA